jgi:hypothetical protein
MITYILNLNSHWQLRRCCSWRGRADLHIYCQCRDRREFYWPERMKCIKEAKQGYSDLLEYSVGSKGTGLELHCILSLNTNCVPLWALLQHSTICTSGTGKRVSFSCSLLIYSVEKSLLPAPLGLLLKKEGKQPIATLWIPEIPSAYFQKFWYIGSLLWGTVYCICP